MTEKKSLLKRLLQPFQSIQSAMITSFAILIVFALLTFLVLSLGFTQRTILENSTEYTAQLIGQVNNDIDSYISYMENISFIVASNSDVYKFLVSKEQEDLAEQVAVLFQTISDTREDITNMGVLTEDGRYVLNGGRDEMNPYVNVEDLSWYQNALAAEGKAVISSSHVQNAIYNNYDWVVTLSRGIRRYNVETPKGVFFVDLNYNAINSLCEDINLGSRGYVFILDEMGNPIYHPQQQLIYSGLKSERFQEVMESESTSFVTEDEHLYTISRSEYTGWTVVGVAYVPELMRGLEETKQLYVSVAIILFLVALGLAFLLSNQITRPIKTLENSMKEVEKGNFAPAVIKESGMSEVESLGRSFNLMTEEIQKLMEETKEVQQAKRISELKVLQNQINPHFLYNTLDSIIWMAEWGKNKEVVVMTSSLAKLLRQSISNEQELVHIEEEIAYTESYLTIQKMRYKDKLEYEISIEEDIQQAEIIKLILQPLVENAIYHGIKYKEGKGFVRISGERKDGCIVLKVQDNGIGMDEETLAHIFEKHERDTRSNGVGLKNVKERIELYYGPEYGLSYESEQGKGTTAAIRIPDQRKEHGTV